MHLFIFIVRRLEDYGVCNGKHRNEAEVVGGVGLSVDDPNILLDAVE